LEHGDVLVVTKLDRLGRNAMDILATVAKLEATGVRVHCLALGGVDLTSAAGKMMMTVVAAMAAFEKDLLLERTQAGLERAWAAGKVSGRRAMLTEDQRADVRAKIAEGASVSALARELGISRMTVMRARDGAAA
jgi:putative DNA-invertase from lambdoid prophage Rac